MDGSSVIFFVMPIVIPLVLFAGIALPYLADSRSRRKDRDMYTTFAARQGSGPVRPRVLIVGAGFAGLKAARALRRADADVMIVDGHDYHTFQPLLSTGEDRAKAVIDWTWAGFTHERAGRITVRTDANDNRKNFMAQPTGERSRP